MTARTVQYQEGRISTRCNVWRLEARLEGRIDRAASTSFHSLCTIIFLGLRLTGSIEPVILYRINLALLVTAHCPNQVSLTSSPPSK